MTVEQAKLEPVPQYTTQHTKTGSIAWKQSKQQSLGINIEVIAATGLAHETIAEYVPPQDFTLVKVSDLTPPSANPRAIPSRESRNQDCGPPRRGVCVQSQGGLSTVGPMRHRAPRLSVWASDSEKQCPDGPRTTECDRRRLLNVERTARTGLDAMPQRSPSSARVQTRGTDAPSVGSHPT